MSYDDKEFDFINDKYTVSEPIYNYINPDYLVFHMVSQERNNIEHDLSTLKKNIRNANLMLKIGNNVIFKLSLLFLLSYSHNEIKNNKIYIKLPFNFMFENIIPICNIPLNHLTFIIDNSCEIKNYVRNFGLKSKYYTLNNVESNLKIQNITVSNYFKNETSNITKLNEYLNNLNTMDTKGIFVECNVEDITDLKFTINGEERKIYENGAIQNYCKIITENMLYVPIENTYISHYSDVIGLLNTSSPLLNLKFANPQKYVGIHNLSINTIDCMENQVYLNMHIYHTILWKKPVVTLHVDMIKKKIMEDEDNICLIVQEPIKENDIYMECDNCNKKFFEHALKEWLKRSNENERTCPNCRSLWMNYLVFISAD
jgi:hypothetical protein